MCIMRPGMFPPALQAVVERVVDEIADDLLCDHGRDAESCDDCNEQRGADQAEASVGK